MSEFESWHEIIKTKLNYPIFGVNAATGEIDEKNPVTEFTIPKINANDNRVIAWVGDEIENLTLIDIDEVQFQSWQTPLLKDKDSKWIFNATINNENSIN